MIEPDTTEAVKRAVVDIAFDWYCPNQSEVPRFQCRECIAEIAIRADREELAKQGYVICKLQISESEFDAAIRGVIARYGKHSMSPASEIATFLEAQGIPIELTDD